MKAQKTVLKVLENIDMVLNEKTSPSSSIVGVINNKVELEISPYGNSDPTSSFKLIVSTEINEEQKEYLNIDVRKGRKEDSNIARIILNEIRTIDSFSILNKSIVDLASKISNSVEKIIENKNELEKQSLLMSTLEQLKTMNKNKDTDGLEQC